MQPAIYVAIIAVIISSISCVIAAKNYKKAKRLEFFQRRDQLFQKISDLNAKNSEFQLIAARFGIVMLKKMTLGVEGEQAQENKAQIASIQRLLKKMELAANLWDESIKELHSVCSNLTLKTDATRIENFIAMVHVASDNAQKYNETHLASLHMLESTEPILKATLAAIDRLEIRQAELDLEEAIREMRNEKPPIEGL